MDEKLVTVVTGASRGIGRSLVEHFIQLGHQVVGVSRAGSTLKAENYVHFTADVADERAVKDIFAELRGQFGRVDHLINNAGIASMNHALLTPISTVNQVFSTNFVGTFLFCQQAARMMQKRRFGRIVNFSTVAVPLKLEGEAIYAASKSAVVTFTEILARELASWDITVNSVGPTPVETDLIKNVPTEKIDKLIERQAIRRFAKMEDIANVVDFFISKKSNFVTGQHLYLGGV